MSAKNFTQRYSQEVYEAFCSFRVAHATSHRTHALSQTFTRREVQIGFADRIRKKASSSNFIFWCLLETLVDITLQ
jgi:hypothetical protein